jgi:hypothetical protein
MKKEFLLFEEARNFVRNLKLKSQKEWNKYIKSGNKPDNIPSDPYIAYKDNGWLNWGDWLGTFTIKNKDFLPFEESRNFVRTLKFNNRKKWKLYCKSGKPDNIPSNPNVVYKDNGWYNWGDWLGTYTIATFNKEYLSFYDAKIYVHTLNLKTKIEYVKYIKSGNKPDNIPSDPYKVYYDKGWINWGDWLGTFTISNQNKQLYYLSEEEFQQFIIANFSDIHPDDMDEAYSNFWNKNEPINLPKYPKIFYNQ